MRTLFSLAVVLLLTGVSLNAQFPVNITAVWDPNPAADNVTNYSLSVNGNNINVPTSNCNVTECTQVITVPSAGTYTLELRAYNFWGSSLPTTFTFNASSPGNSKNLRIRVQ